MLQAVTPNKLSSVFPNKSNGGKDIGDIFADVFGKQVDYIRLDFERSDFERDVFDDAESWVWFRRFIGKAY